MTHCSRSALRGPSSVTAAFAWVTLLLVIAVGCASTTDRSGDDAAPTDAAAADAGADGLVGQDATTDDTGSAADTAADGQTGDDTGSATDGNDTTAVQDSTADTADTKPVDPCAPSSSSVTKAVVMPLGETLRFDGDDYLAFWAPGMACGVTVLKAPAGAKATIVGVSGDAKAPSWGRLTPDVPGMWQLQRGSDVVDLEVVTDYWNGDTFQNYNYAPTQPLVLDPDSDPDAASATLWVAATTSAMVQRVDLNVVNAPSDVQAKAGATIHTGSWPTALATWPGTRTLLVTQTGRDTLGFVDLDAGRMVDAIHLGNEPHNLVVDGSGATAKAWVVLAGEDRVVRVDLSSKTIDASVDVGHEPRALALDAKGRRLYVGSLISGNSHPQGPLQGQTPVPELWQRDVVVIDIDAATSVATLPEVGTINRGLLLERDSDGNVSHLLVATTKADNTKLMVSAETRPHAHHLVRVDAAKLAAGKGNEAIVVDRDLDIDPLTKKKTPAASPYTMTRTPDGAYLVATLSAGRALLFLRPDDLSEVGRVGVGHDPRGLVRAAGRLWTYTWLSDRVEGIALPGAPTEVQAGIGGNGPKIWVFSSTPGPNNEVNVGADPTPPEVRAGQRIFNDAAFSKYGDFSCNNCHIDGLTDGLVWDLLVDGPVNTLAFRNVGGTEPFLWGGQLPTLFDFSREVLKLVGAQASGKQMEQLARYMQSVTAPPNPYALPGGKLTAQAQHGKEVFGKPIAVGGGECAACHSGPLGTSGKTVEGKTKGKETDVPSLLGVYDTLPYGRQGQWFTLGDMVDYALEFTGAKLSPADRDAVLAYVQQLPGDLLTLNSAQPLAGADHVWKEVAPELIFSNVLSKGQEGKFHFVKIAEDGSETPVKGSWALSGRAARFTVDGGKLELESSYRIDVDVGLQSALGQSTTQDISVAFATGGTPAFDISGQWKMTLSSPTVGTIHVNVAVLMATGGKMTGVVLDQIDQASVGADAITGVVSGTTLQLDPFYVDSDFGKFYVKDGFASTLEDTNKDGFADKGKGAFDFKFGNTVFPISVGWKRTALPKG